MERQQPYQAYLLRCWQESYTQDGTPIWRFSLEGVKDCQRRGFADLQALHIHLQQLIMAENDKESAGVSSK